MEKLSTKKNKSPYNGGLTREQFLFHEMRTTANLMIKIESDRDIIEKIISENLYQYPTNKSLKLIASCCVKRLRNLNDIDLVNDIATQPSNISKQICLYALMKYNRIVFDFMMTVIAEKYRVRDFTFTKQDMNVFFLRLQEQDDAVASWSDITISKIKSVLKKVLIENEYLDNTKTEVLNPVLLNLKLKKSICDSNDENILPAFNCFS